MANTTHDPAPPFFLLLPVELRLEIYAYLLHWPIIAKPITSNTTLAAHPKIYPSLLLANRQINQEATPYLYAHNTFLAHPSLLTSFPRLRNWFPPLRESTVLPLIKRFHVTIRLDCDLSYNAEAAKNAFSGLEELSVEVIQRTFMGTGWENLKVLEGVRGVRRLRIYGSTTGFESYVTWLQDLMMSAPDTGAQDFVASEATSWADRLVNRNNLIAVG